MQSDITSAVPSFDHGRVTTIPAAVQLSSTSRKLYQGVWVKAAAGNGGTVYVGNSDVTAGTAATTDGYPLAAGAEILVPVTNLNAVYVIGSDVGQNAYWLAA